MKITQTPRDDHQVELTVEIEADQMEAAKRRAARKLSERGKVPGFRPGKAPYDVVRRHYGDEVILEEALEMLVDEVYPKVLDQEKIEPAAPASLEKVESTDPVRLVFCVPLAPTVELGDYKSLRQPYEYVAPSDEEVEQAIQEIRRMYGKTQAVERPIEVEDFVLIDLRGRKVKAKDGEDPLVVERKGLAIYIAKEPRENEFPYAGFGHELIGLKAGDKKTISHKFGKDVEDEKLRGATVEFEVAVRSVRGPQLPELDDEFARTTGIGETFEEMRANVRRNLEWQSKSQYDDAYYDDLLEKIKAEAVIKYPPQLVEQEIGQMLQDLKQRLADQGLEYETFLKVREMDEAQFIEQEVRPAAIRRLERRLLLDELVVAENVKLDNERVRQEFMLAWAELTEANEAFRRATNDGKKMPQNLVDAVMFEVVNNLIVEQTLGRLKAIATGQAETPAEETGAGAGSEDEPPAVKPKKRPAAKKSE